MLEVERVTNQWLSEAWFSLSYWMSRFTLRSGILNGEKVHDFSNPVVEPDGFRELSFQQACIIVGVLMESDL
ncbi:DUF6025 family protein [Effusibacillus lacus]